MHQTPSAGCTSSSIRLQWSMLHGCECSAVQNVQTTSDVRQQERAANKQEQAADVRQHQGTQQAAAEEGVHWDCGCAARQATSAALLALLALALWRRRRRLAAGCRAGAGGDVRPRSLRHKAFILGQQPLRQWDGG